MDECAFCDPPGGEVFLQDGPCFAMWTRETPEGSAMILPRRHFATPFELDADEWSATHRLLTAVRAFVAGLHQPDGWNVGWNVDQVGGQSVTHAHCHVIPRFADEPFAGKGLRWWFKSDANRRE